MDEDITSENADYHIELVVGQKVTISGEELSGYDLSGMDIVEIEDLMPGYIFAAKKVGIANGQFYLGEDWDKTKTFYITVKEASSDNIEDLSLTIE